MKQATLRRKTPIRARATMRRVRNNWVKMCDDLWSQLVRKLGYCIVCGKTHGLHAHHGIRRSRSKRYRHDVHNGFCLCFECHEWAELRPGEFESWLSVNQPRRMTWIEKHEHEPPMTEKIDYREVYKCLQRLNARC